MIIHRFLIPILVFVSMILLTCDHQNPGAPEQGTRVTLQFSFMDLIPRGLSAPLQNSRPEAQALLRSPAMPKAVAAPQSIDRVQVVFYAIDLDYDLVHKSYVEKDEEVIDFFSTYTGDNSDFQGYWLNLDKGELDIVIPGKYRIEKTGELVIKNQTAHGEFELTAGLKGCRVGLWERERLTHIGRSSGIDNSGFFEVRANESNKISVFLSPVSIEGNSAPTAAFTVTPASGTTGTIFTVDASGCSDNEDPVSVLQVRWDWENDGLWDTDFNTNKTATHRYDTEGVKTILMQVQDLGDLSEPCSTQVTVTDETGGETVTDIDGNVYKTIKIGDQWWMAENLKVTHYRTGDAIPEVSDALEWSNLYSGAYCNYNSNEANGAIYGRLYNWYAVNDDRNLAPEGWHVPGEAEWQILVDYLGGESVAGGKMKETGTAYWNSPNTGATNESGFSVLPGGYRSSLGRFSSTGSEAFFWSSTEHDNLFVWHRFLSTSDSNINSNYYDKHYGFSIRCLRN